MLQIDMSNLTNPVASAAPAQPMRALVLEDNKFDQRKIERISHQTGLNVQLIFADTAGALQAYIENDLFDIILLDYVLPDCTGFEALQLVHASRKNAKTPIVMVAGDSAIDAGAIQMQEAADAHIAKDNLNADTLRACLVDTVKQQPNAGRIAFSTDTPLDADLGDNTFGSVQGEIEDILRHIRMARATQSKARKADVAMLDSVETRLIHLWHHVRKQADADGQGQHFYTIQ